MSRRHYHNLDRLCLQTFLSLCVNADLICFQEHPTRSFEMQVSTRGEVCLCESRRMFSQMLPATLKNFFSVPSRRSWEEFKKSYKPKDQNETRCDRFLNSCLSELHPFRLAPASVLLWWTTGKKKKRENLPLANQLLQLQWIRHNYNHSW